MLTAAVCGFIFASAAASRAKPLNSIVGWRVPLRWWLVALFLPAALALGSVAIALGMGGAMTASVRAGLPAATWAWWLLRSVLVHLAGGHRRGDRLAWLDAAGVAETLQSIEQLALVGRRLGTVALPPFSLMA